MRYWVALTQIPGIGPHRGQKILQKIGHPQALFDRGLRTAQQLGLKPAQLESMENIDWSAIEKYISWAEAPGKHLLTLDHPDYPEQLKRSYAPLVLYVHGNLSLLTSPQVAMVGARNPTTAGRETAHDFAANLANSGMTITSGLADGIDGASHKGALSVNGDTIAVMATGLDRVYPAHHRDLAWEIAEKGLIVSEYPPGTPVRKERFPQRNRLIAGLSLGTIVVEAALRSGSLITARHAVEFGREVFAIPGSIHNPLAKGCHMLIRQGAKLVEQANDIFEELAPTLSHLISEDQKPKELIHPQPVHELSAQEAKIMEAMGYETTSIELIVERTHLPVEEISSTLLVLEMQGIVQAEPGGYRIIGGGAS